MLLCQTPAHRMQAKFILHSLLKPMSNLTRAIEDEAFGIIPILKGIRPRQFLLIQHHAGHWGFPKGHADPGESAVQSACREFTEETGVAEFSLLENISFAERYAFTRNGCTVSKTVVYYPAIVPSAVVSCQAEEIQNYAWLEYEKAIATLTFDGARRVLTEVHHYLNSTEQG
jgi:bis(5'-nucleosidyl)-tetraphosphatase